MVAAFNIILEFAMASPIADSQTHNSDWQSCLIQTLSEPIAECHVLKAVEIVAEVDSLKDTGKLEFANSFPIHNHKAHFRLHCILFAVDTE